MIVEKKYTKILEVLRSTAEFAQDYSNMQRCEKNVNTYDRMAQGHLISNS